MIETGIHFGEIHSFYDLNLVLSSVEISPAQPKTNYIDIPGGDGTLDFTEAHGEIKYSDREITMLFSVFPQDDLTFEERKTVVSNALNGKKFKITLDKDAEYYYEGRVTVDDFRQDKNLKQFTITATVHPYKWRQNKTVEVVALTTQSRSVVLKNGRKSVVPTIKVSSHLFLTVDGKLYDLYPGEYKILDVYLTEGDNVFEMYGAGTATFTYQEGDL